MSKIEVKIVADSINQQNDRIISMLLTYPRIIHSELMTHRMLSKNSASSRAIPFKKMAEAIQNDPFIPIAWQKEHKGMQGSEYIINQEDIEGCDDMWLHARDYAIQCAENLNTPEENLPAVTKQLCNRLLEPFMWTTMLITGSKEGWDNFFKLRCPSYTFHTDESEKDFIFKSKKDAINYFPKDEVVEYETGNVLLKDLTDLQWLQVNQGQAEIHMMALAECIWNAYNESTPKVLKAGEWHIPFLDKIDYVKIQQELNLTDSIQCEEAQIKISTSMSARTSYTVVGDEKEVSYQKHIELYEKLINQKPLHASPMEHCARVMTNEEYNTYIKGKSLYEESTNSHIPIGDSLGWCRNFKGFIQLRELLENGNISR